MTTPLTGPDFGSYAAADAVHINADDHVFCIFLGNGIVEIVNILATLLQFLAPLLN